MTGQARSEGRKILDGVRVLDFTRVLSGPYCTALIADLGADVVKVESPDGDDYRHIGPFVAGESALFATVNRGKRSIVLDLKAARSRRIALALARRADIVVENFRPGVMAKLGLGWPDLSAINPRLVYVSISGFGQTGPNTARPAYDIVVQAMSGLMSITGVPDGPPTMVGEAIGDVAAGLFAAWGCMVALFDRERTGEGRHVDVAMFDALLAMMPTPACRHLAAGEQPERVGNRHPLSAPFGVYRARDGYFTVAVLNEKLFAIFAEVVGRSELTGDPQFASDALRRANEPALAAAIEGWAGALSVAETVAALTSAGIPASPIASIAQAWASEQAEQRTLSSIVTHRTMGAVRLPEQPVHFGDSPRGGRRPAPSLNEHEAEILAELDWEGSA
ncbi:MAG: CoA transferase [Dongiaceae bacterium]